MKDKEEIVQRFYRNWFWIVLIFLIMSIYDSKVKDREIIDLKEEIKWLKTKSL